MNQFQQTMQQGREGGFLRLACDVGLILSAVLWIFAQISLINLAPSGADVASYATVVLRGGVSVVLALGCAVVLPALLAIIFPFTPAGQLLQETRRSTWGFPVMMGAAGYLGWYSYQIVSAFWAASLNVADFAPMQTLATLIVGVVVPALAFSWSSPLTWMAEVQQAHMVKKLRLQHQADIALAKTAYFRAIDRLRVGIANLTMAERQEVAMILAGLQRAQNDTLTAIAGTFRTIAGAELAAPTMDDDGLVKRFNDLAAQLEGRVLDVENDPDEPAPRELTAPETPFDVTSRAAEPAHADSRSGPSIPRADDGAQRRATQRHAPPRAAEYEAAIQRFGTVEVWTARELSDVLKTEVRTAQESIADWKRAELLDETRLGRYRFRDIRGQ